MTVFDVSVIGFVALSMLFAFARGIVREVVALIAWVVGFVAALQYSPALAAFLPDWNLNPMARQIAAFVVILVVVLTVSAFIGWFLKRTVQAIGLGFIDRLLGAVFGIARGVLVTVILVLLAGLTPLPRADWWQNALLRRPLELAALSLRSYLPPEWAQRIDYSIPERRKLVACNTQIDAERSGMAPQSEPSARSRREARVGPLASGGDAAIGSDCKSDSIDLGVTCHHKPSQ